MGGLVYWEMGMMGKMFERRGGRVTKWKGQVASIAPYMLMASVSVAALGMSPAMAATEINSSNTTVEIDSGNIDVIILPGALIDPNDLGIAVIDGLDDIDFSADMTNLGTINVINSQSSLQSNSNDTQDFDFTGVVINKATAVTSASAGQASATGIFFSGDLSGTLTNDGTINVIAYGGDTAAAEAYATAGAGSAAVANAYASAIARAGGAYAVGVVVDDELSGELLNIGSVTIRAYGGDDAYAYASAYASARNAGDATATAIAKAYAGNASAIGVEAEELSGGNGGLVNEGTVLIEAFGGDNARAYATVRSDEAVARYATDAMVSASVMAAAGNAYAALAVVDDMAGSLTNNGGTITITATGGDNALAYASANDADAVYRSGFSGPMGRTGEVVGRAEAFAGNATAYGVESLEDIGSVTNSGTLTISATGGDYASAFAITSGVDVAYYSKAKASAIVSAAAGGAWAALASAGEDVVNITNSGTITILASGGHSAYASAYMSDVSAQRNGSFGARDDLLQSGQAYAGNAWAFGADAGEDVVGFTNLTNGTITIRAIGGDYATATARADGVEADRARAMDAAQQLYAYAGNAYAYGARAGEDIIDAANNGMIYVTAAGGDSAFARANQEGVYLTSASRAEFASFGLASAGNAEAYWIKAEQNLQGDLVNSGIINVRATGGASADAEVEIDEVFINNIDGDVTAALTGLAFAGNATAIAAVAGDSLHGTFTNSGTINVMATGGNNADAQADHDDPMSLENGYTSAAMSAEVLMVAEAGNARAAGVFAGTTYNATDVLDSNDLIGVVTNSGTMNVSAYGGDGATASAEFSTVAVIPRNGSAFATAQVEGIASAGNAYAVGIGAGRDIAGAGSVVNSGTINIMAVGGASAEAYAGTDDSVYASDASSGDARVFMYAAAGNAYGAGIDAGEDITGDVTNSGAILVTVTGGNDATASAYLTDVYVTNVGRALAYGTASAFGGNAEGYGMRAGRDLNGTMINSGTINVSVTGGNDNNVSAYATSVRANYNSGGSGTSYANAFAYAGNAYAYGMDVGRDLTSDESLHNTGNIIVSAQGGNSNLAYASATTNGGGTGYASAYAEAGNAYAYGMNARRDLTGAMSNSGSINVSATGGDSNYASASANADNSRSGSRSGMAFAYGMNANGEMNGTMTNMGSIFVSATGGQGNYSTSNGSNNYADAEAFGMKVGDDGSGGVMEDGVMSNMGIIHVEARAFGDADARAYGIYADYLEDGATLLITGKSVARVYDSENTGETVGDDAYAVYLGGGDGDVEIGAPSFFEGKLRVADQNVTITNGPGTSVNWTFEDVESGSGSFTLDGPLPWYVRNGGTDNPSYATYDPTGLAAQSNMVADLAGSVSLLGQFGLSKVAEGSQVVPTADAPGADDEFYIWMTGINSQRGYHGDEQTTLDHDITNNAVAIGASFDIGGDFLVSVLGGYNWGDIDEANGEFAGTSDIDTTGGFAGIFGLYDLDMFTLGAGVAGGMFSQDRTRTVNNNLVWGGIEELESDTDGYWVSPEISASATFDLTGAMALRPTVTGRYIFGSIDGYDEGASDSAAVVGDQDVSVFEVDANAMMDFNTGFGILSAGGGYLFRSDNSDEEVDVAIFGVTNGMPVLSSDGSAPYAQAVYTVNMFDSMSLDINGRMLFPQDGEVGTDIMAKLKINF
jgi:hypothetical protein